MNEDKIKQEIVDQLIWDDRIVADEVHIDFENGKIILQGKVGNLLSKRMAEKKAYRVNGVKEVENKLTVDNRVSDRPKDHNLKESIERGFYWNDYLDYSKLQVMVDHGLVTLQGTVDAFWKKQLAADIAENVRGTMEIINQIVVEKNQNSDDQQILEALYANLKSDENIDESKIEATVVSGYVTLSGKVKNRDQNMQAYETALYTRGVTGIDNQLVISNDRQNDFS
ncbi:MAG: BON domain-containing protein [Cyclobacteriaceae bacterium]